MIQIILSIRFECARDMMLFNDLNCFDVVLSMSAICLVDL
jgi:hypothetical protein